ncbi:KptA family-domain-containing protein [Lentinula raphanica]|nr:KptA family-domain-containing protein [Lentinula raphanica]
MLFAGSLNARFIGHLRARSYAISTLITKPQRLGRKRFKNWFEIINVKTAKVGPRLAWLLRHGARHHNLYIRPDGFALVEEVLRISPFRRLNLPDLKEIARIDPLKRLQVKELRPRQWWIRATTKHSLEFVYPTWTEITTAHKIKGAMYLTDIEGWQNIQIEGIRTTPHERLIHLHQTLPEHLGYSRTLIVFLLYKRLSIDQPAIRYGFTFFRTHEKKIATEGDEYGCIAPRFFQKVERLQWSRDMILDKGYCSESGSPSAS